LPNIKVDVPTSAGWQTPTTQIDFYVFNDKLVDGSQGIVTLDLFGVPKLCSHREVIPICRRNRVLRPDTDDAEKPERLTVPTT